MTTPLYHSLAHAARSWHSLAVSERRRAIQYPWRADFWNDLADKHSRMAWRNLEDARRVKEALEIGVAA